MRSDSHPVHGDPRLSRFDPMERVIYFDDFDQGMNGWTCLVGNYQDSLDTMTTSYARHTQPMLSQITHWDSGTHGSFDGTYALKIATRPVAGERNTAIKRVTFRKASRIRVETYFACKPEANELKLSDKDVRTFGVLFDLQDRQQRVMPHLRYLNTLNGERRHQWQFKQRTTPFRAIGGSEIVTHDHLSPDDWEDVPGGHQNLCYNEIPTKIKDPIEKSPRQERPITVIRTTKGSTRFPIPTRQGPRTKDAEVDLEIHRGRNQTGKNCAQNTNE